MIICLTVRSREVSKQQDLPYELSHRFEKKTLGAFVSTSQSVTLGFDILLDLVQGRLVVWWKEDFLLLIHSPIYDAESLSWLVCIQFCSTISVAPYFYYVLCKNVRPFGLEYNLAHRLHTMWHIYHELNFCCQSIYCQVSSPSYKFGYVLGNLPVDLDNKQHWSNIISTAKNRWNDHQLYNVS